MLDQDHTGKKCLRAQMTHAVRGGDSCKMLPATSRDDRMRDEMIFIDEFGLDRSRCDRRSAPHEDIATAQTLQARNGLDAAGKYTGVAPLHGTQRTRENKVRRSSRDLRKLSFVWSGGGAR